MFSRQCNRLVRGLASRLLEIEQHRQVIARDKTHDRRHRRGALSPPPGAVRRSIGGVFRYDIALFRGAGGQALGQLGPSKGYRPNLKQIILGIVLDGSDRPFASFLRPATPQM
jgi:hypothetical protein